jgi:zinc transporter, ZIP family
MLVRVAQSLLFGAVSSAALLAGALLGAYWKPPEHLWASLLAFAGGALTAALAFELFAEADELGGVGWAAVGLGAGALTFVLVDAHLLSGMRGGAASLALLAAVTLDGIPENLALGVSLTHGASYALLLAIFASNFPEALGSAVQMRERGESRRFALGVWSVAAALLALSVVVGTSLLDAAPSSLLAVLLGFAGGAVLASLAVTVFPQAFSHGGPYVALATVAGFLFAYLVAEV